MHPSQQHLTTREAAPLLGIKYETLKSWRWRWRGQNRGPRFIRINGRVFYRAADINSWIEAHIVETNGDGRWRKARA